MYFNNYNINYIIMPVFKFKINMSVGSEIPVLNNYLSFSDFSHNEVDIGGGMYEVDISWSSFTRMHNYDGLDFYKVSYVSNESIDIMQFDNIPISETIDQFRTFNGIFSATDAPILPTNCENFFYQATNFNSNISHWDVSNVTNMKNMFQRAASFNQDISCWDVSNVTSMEGLFESTIFNQPLNPWKLNSCLTIKSMFKRSEFNQPLNEWNVGTVKNMHYTFSETTYFNQDINDWDVSGNEQFRGIFFGAKLFNSPLDKWDVKMVTAFEYWFTNAPSFNQDISCWNISNAVILNRLFQNATSFNQDISPWDLSNVTNIFNIFQGATSFNQDITGWNVSMVENFSGAFDNAKSFTYNLGSWDYSSATNLRYMILGNGYDYIKYSEFIQALSVNATLPDNADFGFCDKFRIDNVETNAAFEALRTKGIIFNDGDAYSEEDLLKMSNVTYTQLIMNDENSGETTTITGSEEYVYITDSGGLNGAYGGVEDISHTYILSSPIEMTIYLATEEINDVLKIYDTDINGTLLYDMSGNDKQVINISTISQIYVSFISNNIGITTGYSILIKSEALLSSRICFRKNTAINTDQGIIPINNINTAINTINGYKILFITKTLYNDKLVLIKKNALGNIPTADTVVSKQHVIIYDNKPIHAKNLVNYVDILFIDAENENEVLYNILMENHCLINVNGLLTETLHPNNNISKIYNNTKYFDDKMRNKFFNKINTLLSIDCN